MKNLLSILFISLLFSCEQEMEWQTTKAYRPQKLTGQTVQCGYFDTSEDISFQLDLDGKGDLKTFKVKRSQIHWNYLPGKIFAPIIKYKYFGQKNDLEALKQENINGEFIITTPDICFQNIF